MLSSAESVVTKLEFDKVLHRIQSLASSEPGKELALLIRPLHSKQEVAAELARVTEAKELVIAEGYIPLDGIKNILESLKRASVANQFLSILDLLDVASTLKASRAMNTFLSKHRKECPSLEVYISRLLSEKVVEYNITQALDPQGFVKDSASKELRTIRQDIVHAGEHLRKRLSSILRQISDQEFLQEEIITTRDGRLVIPVKVEHKNHVSGFIHSSSASGATVFIEPAETLDLNNGLRELHLREEREIQRILLDLTLQVREIAEPLEFSVHALEELDLIFAKAKYSIEILGTAPILTDKKRIKLVQARHPVLLQRHTRQEVMPLDLELGDDTTTLIITGPNAGGKTVALKTVGLLALCVKAGLHIPAAEESEMCVFDEVFADIGDDQSIEQDLSTFSSHLMQLGHILSRANESSLVLVDEIGAGTDPAEGGALAAATLQELTRRKAITIATTHHGMLKVFAHETPGMANGSMEFDQETLRPTYRFRFGIPGSSFALELAERLGIDKTILDNARKELGEGKAKLESLIADLEKQSQLLSGQLNDAAHERDRLQSLVGAYDQKMAELKKELAAIKRKAVEEARQLVQDARATIEHTVKEIRENAATKEIVKSAKEGMRNLAGRFEEMTAGLSEHEELRLAVGDTVKIKGANEIGEIVELQGNSAFVLRGQTRIKANVLDLVKQQKPERSDFAYSSPVEIQGVKNEIDLRGLMGDEAINEVERFLDNAYVAGLGRVDIIHGKGTGALRKRIGDFLKEYPKAKSFRLGEWNEGGTGVTVVELKE